MSACSVFCLSALSSTSPDLSCNRLAPEPPGEAGGESLNPSAQIYSALLSLSLPYRAVGTALRNWLSLPGMGSSFHEKKDNVIPFRGVGVLFFASLDGVPPPSAPCCLLCLSISPRANTGVAWSHVEG